MNLFNCTLLVNRGAKIVFDNIFVIESISFDVIYMYSFIYVFFDDIATRIRRSDKSALKRGSFSVLYAW